jgi:hypothetical protein
MHQPRGSIFRFSLRTLLILVTLGAAAFGWFGIKTRQAQRQSAAVAAVRNLGGYVRYDYEIDSVGNQEANASAPTSAWLRKALGDDFCAEVKHVILCGRDTSDETLEQIRGIPRLESLNVSYTTKITDDGLANLAKLTELRELRMSSNTRVTDVGVAHLQALPQLELLFLDDTQITDAGLVHLKGLKQLKILDLTNTQVTEDGCNQLMKTLPNLDLYH